MNTSLKRHVLVLIFNICAYDVVYNCSLCKCPESMNESFWFRLTAVLIAEGKEGKGFETLRQGYTTVAHMLKVGPMQAP